MSVTAGDLGQMRRLTGCVECSPAERVSGAGGPCVLSSAWVLLIAGALHLPPRVLSCCRAENRARGSFTLMSPRSVGGGIGMEGEAFDV
jgi:hypothetical protein